MDPDRPPASFDDDATDVLVTSANPPPPSPQPVPNYPQQPRSDLLGPAGPELQRRGRRWMLPVAIIAVGVIGVGLFAALSLKKARDELQAAKGALADSETRRGELEAEYEKKLTAAESESDRLEQELKVATRVASKAENTIAKTSKKADELEKKLRSLASETSSEVERDGERLTLKLVDKVLFRSGESELTERGKRYLKKVGATLEASDQQIWVQGHTDNVPVARSNPRFKSNWELSSARALTVVHFLENEVRIKGRRLAVVAFSKYRPVSRRRKARNRRIEIVLAPRSVRLVD
jgi:chemotaxis protein MotB